MQNLISKVIEYTGEHEMLPDSGLVLVCVSGGADSICLLEVMRHISYERGFSIAVLHFNHELRMEESDRDETFVMNVCNAHEIPFYVGRGNVYEYSENTGCGVEQAGRNMRYGFFYDMADKLGADTIATGHTLDDNAETLLINIARGAGTNGMSGIPPVRDKVIRPLLSVSREEIENFAGERGIPYVEDSTNQLDIFTRNFVRHKIVPIMKELNPRFIEAAGITADISRKDEDFISDIADMFISDLCVGNNAPAEQLDVLPFSVSSRVIKKLCGDNLSYNHVKDVLSLCQSDNPSASLSLPGMIVYREYDRVIFDKEKRDGDDEFAPVYPTVDNSVIILAIGLKISCKLVSYDDSLRDLHSGDPFTIFLFKNVDICGRIAVRPRREGDEIRLKGQRGTKSIKKLFIEKKIPARKRKQVPIICDDKGVLAILGVGVSDRAAPSPGDTALMLIFEELY